MDVALRDGQLFVTHDPSDVDPGALLRDLYLDPLEEIARANGGRIYGAAVPPLQLLIDVKSAPAAAYEALEELLAGYDDLVTSWADDAAAIRAVTVVVSGNRATERIRARSVRRVSLDGRIWDDRIAFTPVVMPLVSVDWEEDVDARDRMASARRMVEQVHAEGRALRFWGTPDDPELWTSLRALGVDFIGADDVPALARFAGLDR